MDVSEPSCNLRSEYSLLGLLLPGVLLSTYIVSGRGLIFQ